MMYIIDMTRRKMNLTMAKNGMNQRKFSMKAKPSLLMKNITNRVKRLIYMVLH